MIFDEVPFDKDDEAAKLVGEYAKLDNLADSPPSIESLQAAFQELVESRQLLSKHPTLYEYIFLNEIDNDFDRDFLRSMWILTEEK